MIDGGSTEFEISNIRRKIYPRNEHELTEKPKTSYKQDFISRSFRVPFVDKILNAFIERFVVEQ